MATDLKLIKNQTLCITATGMKIILPGTHQENDFVASGKLWAMNAHDSEKAGQPVYHEVSEAMCHDMHKQASLVLQLANDWWKKLQDMKTPINGLKPTNDKGSK